MFYNKSMEPLKEHLSKKKVPVACAYEKKI